MASQFTICLSLILLIIPSLTRFHGLTQAVFLEQRDPKELAKSKEVKVRIPTIPPAIVPDDVRIPPSALVPSEFEENETNSDPASFVDNPVENQNLSSEIPPDNQTFFGLEFRAGAFANDMTTTTEADVTTTTEPTPHAFPVRGSGRTYGQRCNWYGSEFYMVQTSGIKIEDNMKARGFSQQICRINHRLECIPSRVQDEPVAPATGGGGGSGGSAVHTIKFSESANRRGFCRCARALSDRALYLRRNKGDTFATGCYIPAGFSHSSLCGHEVALPYGLINNGTLIRKTVGNTKDMCVPNAECRIGYTYTGLRCACLKTAEWHREDGTCVVVEAGHRSTIPGLWIQILIGILTVNFMKYTCL